MTSTLDKVPPFTTTELRFNTTLGDFSFASTEPYHVKISPPKGTSVLWQRHPSSSGSLWLNKIKQIKQIFKMNYAQLIYSFSHPVLSIRVRILEISLTVFRHSDRSRNSSLVFARLFTF